MIRADLRIRLADGTEVGYAEAGVPAGYPVLHLHGTPGSLPIEIWHGEDDRLVSPQQSRILAAAVPGATHFVAGQGHLLLAGDHAKAALQSALGS
jgi:fermentation-respiration switch protein FrsA (DUF1100 family)